MSGPFAGCRARAKHDIRISVVNRLIEMGGLELGFLVWVFFVFSAEIITRPELEISVFPA